jgi:hypothetical protein
MTDLRDAARQALEALEFMADEWGFTQKANRPERWQAITALKAALEQPEQKREQPEQVVPYAVWRQGFDAVRKYKEQPEQAEPDAYGYASRLAVAIWEKHYKATAVNWKPLPDLMGVLTQIDNMTAGLTRQQAEPEQEPVVWGVDWGGHGDRSCCTIIKQHTDGTWEVVAVEYAPSTPTHPTASGAR